MTKTERVRNLLAAGKLTPMEIARNVKVSKSYVYGLKAKMKPLDDAIRERVAKPKTEVGYTISLAKPNGQITVAEFVAANKLDAFQHIVVDAVIQRTVSSLDIAKRIIDLMMGQGS